MSDISRTYTLASKTTTDPFTDLGDVLDLRSVGPGADVIVVVSNTGGTNGVSYQVLGSVDGTTYVVSVASANLAANTSVGVPVNDPWPYVKVQVKAQVGGSQTTVKASAFAR